jgi:hypothetical protein
MRFIQISKHRFDADKVTHLAATRDRGGNEATHIFFIGGDHVTVGGNPRRVESMIRTLAAAYD